VWRFEQGTFFIGSLRVKLILACQEVLGWVWPSMNRNGFLFVQIQTLLPLSKHPKWKEIIDIVCKQPMGNHKGSNPDKKSYWFLKKTPISTKLLGSKDLNFVNLRVFHPCDTIEITQTGLVFWRWWWVHARTISSPAALLGIRGSGHINIQPLRQKSFKNASTLTCLQVYHLQ
jgi:hypothetical protein